MKVGSIKNEAWPKDTLGSEEEHLILGEKRTSVSLHVKERGWTGCRSGLLALIFPLCEFRFRHICMYTRLVHALFKQIGLFLGVRARAAIKCYSFYFVSLDYSGAGDGCDVSYHPTGIET